MAATKVAERIGMTCEAVLCCAVLSHLTYTCMYIHAARLTDSELVRNVRVMVERATGVIKLIHICSDHP